MPIANLVSFDAGLKDRYPRPGDRIKQYVVNERLEREWDLATCPKVDAGKSHNDNTDDTCWCSGPTPWIDLFYHPHCSICGENGARSIDRGDIVAWRMAKRERPSPDACGRDVLSDEIAPDLSLRDNPMFRMLK